MLLNILQCTGQPSSLKTTIQPQMSVMLQRNAALGKARVAKEALMRIPHSDEGEREEQGRRGTDRDWPEQRSWGT